MTGGLHDECNDNMQISLTKASKDYLVRSPCVLTKGRLGLWLVSPSLRHPAEEAASTWDVESVLGHFSTEN